MNKTVTTLTAAGMALAANAEAAELSVDFGEVVGQVRPALHASGMGGQLVGVVSGKEPELLAPLNLWGARTHDWALINAGQRICDTHFVFPLLHLDPSDPSNYFFGPTDEILDRTVNLLGLNVLFRMGTSIESVNTRRTAEKNPRYYNSVEPEDWGKYVGALEGIIRHYTEGWANGFKWGEKMRYWELWNEPNDRPGGSWIVTSQDPDKERNDARFFEFFVYTLGRLKARFPHLKFGGPAVCYRDEKFLRALLAKCREAGYAPDFISWHNYSCEPDMMLDEPAKIRAICDEYGFTDTELMINEWHYITPGRFWGDNSTEAMARRIDPTTGLGGIDSSVYTLQVLCGLQSTCLDQAYFYGCNYAPGSWWGILKPDGRPNKVYYGLEAFGSAIAAGDHLAKTQGSKAVRLFGVSSADGARKALLVTAFKTPAGEIEVEVKGVAPDAKPSCLLLDDAHDLADCPVSFKDGKLTLRKADDLSAAFYIMFQLPATNQRSGVLHESAGLVTEKTLGWRFEASGGNGGQTFNPLEGWYPDKGGKLISPRIAIPKAGAYYKVSFTASAPERSFECVAFYDAAGKMVADNYDVVYPDGMGNGEEGTGKGKQGMRYSRVVFAQEGVKAAEVFFQSARGCTASDVTFEVSSPEEAAAWCDKVYAKVPVVKVEPDGKAFLSAPKTLEALKTGRPVRILLLGDSIIQDTFHSQFHALLKRAYPKSEVTWLMSVRGGTGCWYYRVAENFETYVAAYRPDCVIVGGISNWQPPKPDYPVSGNGDVYEVGEMIRSRGMELIVVSPTLSVDTRMKEYSREFTPLAPRAYNASAEKEALSLTIDKYSKLPSGLSPEGLAELKAECARRGWGFIDAFTPAYRWLYESGKPWSWHNRDYVHSGELGKQVIARIMLAHLAAPCGADRK